VSSDQTELPSSPSGDPNPEAAKILARREPRGELPRRSESTPISKHSRRTPKGQTRLHMSVGMESGISRDDIIRAIQGQTGLPSSAIGEVDLRERHSFVDVASEHANAIVSKLKRSELGNQRLKVKLASRPDEAEP